MMILAGCYVKVDKVPGSWEGSGESLEERMALVGHIGVVLERDEDFAFVRFPRVDESCDEEEPSVYERNIEIDALTVVSKPLTTLPSDHY